MSREMPTQEQLDAVCANAETMLWWQGCASIVGATAEVMIAMVPTGSPGEYQPAIWARPDGIWTDQLSRLLRQLADEIDAGRCQTGGVQPTPDSGTAGPKSEAGSYRKCCPNCGDIHGPDDPCSDF